MKHLLAAATLAIPSALASQSTYHVLPAGYEGVQDAYHDSDVLGCPSKNSLGKLNTPVHIQTGYAMSDLGPSIFKIGSIAYRRNNYFGTDLGQSVQTLAVYVSRSAVPTSAYTASFAKNAGPSRTQVFGKSGQPAILNWPGSPYVNNGGKVAPFLLKIPFNYPFVVTSLTGTSLCIDFDLRSRVVTPKTGTWTPPAFFLMLDAAGESHGEQVLNGIPGLSCTFSSTKRFQSGVSGTTRGLTTSGGPWSISYRNVPPLSLGIATLSSMGLDTRPNPFKLPIDLGPIGMPHCVWNVGLETGFWVPLKADAKGVMQWPTMTVPAGLPPLSVYDQALVLDPKANRLGLVATWSFKWNLIKAINPKCVTVSRFNDTTPPASTGTVWPTFAAVVRLDV